MGPSERRVTDESDRGAGELIVMPEQDTEAVLN